MELHEAQVSEAGLTYIAADGNAQTIAVDSPCWYTWLEVPDNNRLVFAHPTFGLFIMRRERKQRGGWYWSMYRRIGGRLRKSYLGKSKDLTLERLQGAVQALMEQHGSDPPASVSPLVAPPAPPVPTPLLSARLAPPPARTRLVQRSRLVRQLTAALDRPLTLIAAPAGSGKTTLLTAWAAAAPVPVAWLALDAGDNDPARFLAYLCAALDRLQPDVSAAASGLLQSPQPVPAETVLTMLLNAFDLERSRGALVLDDYHLIVAPAIHAALTFLVDHLPPCLRLLIASRTDPPLPLPRLRARGQLTELRAEDLRFNADEAGQFLADVMGLRLSNSEVAVLEQHTEGWAAGLHLAALAVQGRSGGADVVAAATGSQRAIVDYLATEVLEGQPPEVQQFLLCTSILERLSGELCDRLFTIDDLRFTISDLDASIVNSQTMLEQLERANLFLVPLDAERQWYRYHQLFGDFLRARLQRTQPEMVPLLHRRAATWYANHAMLVEAVSHAQAASDVDLVAQLVEQSGRRLLMRSEVVTVLGWIDALPPSLVRARPHLGLIAAWGLVGTGQLDAGAARLDAAEHALAVSSLAADERKALEGEVLAVRAAIAGLKRDLSQAVALSKAALHLLSEEQAYVRSVVAQLLGGAAYAEGDAEGASAALGEALRLSRASGNLFITIFSTRQLADVRVMQGQLREAARLYQQVLGLGPTASSSTDAGAIPGLPVTGTAYVGLGELLYIWNDLPAATDAIKRGLMLGEQGQNAEILLRGSLALARVHAAEGERAAGEVLLARAASVAADTGVPWLAAWVAAEQALWAVRAGDLVAAVRWADNYSRGASEALSYLYETNDLALAQVRIAQGRADPTRPLLRDARDLLERLRRAAETTGRVSSLIEILVLEALATQAQGNINQACATLIRVLHLAQPEGYTRVFLDAGPPLAALLQHLIGRGRAVANLRPIITRLRKAFEQPTTGPTHAVHAMPEPLSPRELEVLHMIAAGQSNQEIAYNLLVAVGTVKKHVNNIFGKLGVTSRTQALAQARAWKLIS